MRNVVSIHLVFIHPYHFPVMICSPACAVQDDNATYLTILEE